MVKIRTKQRNAVPQGTQSQKELRTRRKPVLTAGSRKPKTAHKTAPNPSPSAYAAKKSQKPAGRKFKPTGKQQIMCKSANRNFAGSLGGSAKKPARLKQQAAVTPTTGITSNKKISKNEKEKSVKSNTSSSTEEKKKTVSSASTSTPSQRIMQGTSTDEAARHPFRFTRQQLNSQPPLDSPRKSPGRSTPATENSATGAARKTQLIHSTSCLESSWSHTETDLPPTKKRKIMKSEYPEEIPGGPSRGISSDQDENITGNTEPILDSKLIRRRRTASNVDTASPRAKPLSELSPRGEMFPPEPSEFLFRNRPSWLPRGLPINVLDDWYHGQLVWWNRFLANRKKTRGYSTGYHLGRVVDLDSEWFPSVDLTDTKKRLRLQASQLGRRSVFVQSMDDLRYMAIPPRAITPFPDPDDSRNQIILEGCRANSPSSYRGLLRAQMIETLRDAIGEMNGLLEIELLNLLFHAQGEDPTCSNTEIEYLQDTNVWEVLSTRQVKLGEVCDEVRVMVPPVIASMPSERRISQQQPRSSDLRIRRLSVRSGLPARPGRPRKKKDEVDSDEDLNDEDLNFRRKESSVGDMIMSDSVVMGSRRHRTGSTDAEELQRWVQLCAELCLSRKQLQSMLKGVPFNLLCSPTGIPLPEELPSYTLQVLRKFLQSVRTPSFVAFQPAVTGLIGYHYAAANLFLHRLFQTIVLRVPVAREITESPQIIPNLLLEDPFTDAIMSSVSPDQPRSVASKYDIVFASDHGHINQPTAPTSSPPPSSSPYLCCEPFRCISYYHPPWSSTEKRLPADYCKTEEMPSGQINEEQTGWVKSPPQIRCRRSSLLVVGHGTNLVLPFYSLRLNQISAKRPSNEELETAGRILLESGLDKFSVSELDVRLNRLYNLKEAALQLRSIYEDETTFLSQTKGKLTGRDLRYFQSLWTELLRKLK